MLNPSINGPEHYMSVGVEAETETVIKRSRFISKVRPVASVEEAEGWLAELRGQYADATHVCYAYRIGLETTTSKMSDDGEPKGTAGRPILEVLERREVDNVCLAVIRYYGGTPLGAGGLIRAYAGGAADVLDAATIVKYVIHVHLQIELSYADWAKIEHYFPTWGGHIVDLSYGEGVTLDATVTSDQKDALIEALVDATGGNVNVTEGAFQYRPDSLR